MEEIKSHYARNYTIRRAYSIAKSVGLSQPKVLTDEDIWNITDGADTSATRNAQYLRDFTRNLAYAVVAGMRANNRAQSDIDSGKATWFRLRPRDLAAE